MFVGNVLMSWNYKMIDKIIKIFDKDGKELFSKSIDEQTAIHLQGIIERLI